MRSLSFAVLLVVLALVNGHHEGDGEPHVKTSLGELEGTILETHENKPVEAFLGIPYAKPPVDDLRFRAPVPVEAFSSILKTKKKPPSCKQVSFLGPSRKGVGDFLIAKSEESEDCLYLNVFTTHPRPVNASVMVFIHGGGYMTGSSNMDIYDGRELAADEGVVVVNLNYRLSVFGLLYLGDEQAPGNQGLMDMRLALKFVKAHIADFGGNPKKVTLVGEGSGATSAGLLMLSHSCNCLFQNLVLMNGSPMNIFGVHSKKEATEISDRLATKLGCVYPKHDDHHEIVKCLRTKDSHDLVDASEALLRDTSLFKPLVDGEFLPHHPRVLGKQGAFDTTIKVMLGSSYHRAALINFLYSPLKPREDSYVTKDDLRNLIKDVLRSKTDYETNAIQHVYTNYTHPNDPQAIRHMAIDMATDSFVICPLNKFADELAISGNDVYMFFIRYHPAKYNTPSFAGNLNGEDIDFLLGHATPENGYTELDHQRSHHMMSHLAHFMNNGDPNLSEEDQHFPRYTLRTKSYLDVRPGGTQGHFLRAHQCAFFDHAFTRVKHAAALMASHNC